MTATRHQYRELVRALVPPWLADRHPAAPSVGFRYLYALAAVCDSMIDVAVQGMGARYPGVGTPTALPRIGADRRIIRGPHEGDTPYAKRLVEWLDTWRVAGNAYTVLEQLSQFFAPQDGPLMRIVSNRGVWHTFTPGSGVVQQQLGNWNWDGRADLWARCWVIFYSPFGSPWGPDRKWGDGGKWGDGRTWGSTATRDEVTTLQSIVRLWRAQHTRYVNLIVAFDPTSFNPASPEPNGTWGKMYKLSGFGNQIAVPSRLRTARYWDDAYGGANVP